MNEPASLLFVGESSGIRQALATGVDGFNCVSLSSLNNIDAYLQAFPDRLITCVVIDYMSATEGMGGGGTTSMSCQDRIAQIKTIALREGQQPRYVIGLSAQELWCTQLKAMGCDTAVSESALVGAIAHAFRNKSVQTD